MPSMNQLSNHATTVATVCDETPAPRGANGSRGRYFYAYLMRSLGV